MYNKFHIYAFLQSSKSAKANSIKLARSQGMIAAYLNAAAVVFALVVAFVVSPAVIAAVVPNDLDSCINTGMCHSIIDITWCRILCVYLKNLICVCVYFLSQLRIDMESYQIGLIVRSMGDSYLMILAANCILYNLDTLIEFHMYYILNHVLSNLIHSLISLNHDLIHSLTYDNSYHII